MLIGLFDYTLPLFDDWELTFDEFIRRIDCFIVNFVSGSSEFLKDPDLAF